MKLIDEEGLLLLLSAAPALAAKGGAGSSGASAPSKGAKSASTAAPAAPAPAPAPPTEGGLLLLLGILWAPVLSLRQLAAQSPSMQFHCCWQNARFARASLQCSGSASLAALHQWPPTPCRQMVFLADISPRCQLESSPAAPQKRGHVSHPPAS